MAYDGAALLREATYARLCPQLTLPGAAGRAAPPLPPPALPPAPALAEGLAVRGFSRTTALELWGADALPAVRALLARLSEGVTALVAAGLPPLLVLAFDEAWWVQAAVHAHVRAALPGHAVALNDWAVFHVPPAGAEGGAAAGWPPHRDRPSTPGAASLNAAGAPRYVTCWLPLTPATPETSCLHFLPVGADPGFHAPAPPPPGACPLVAALRGEPAQHQRVVALPAAPGALLAFGSRTLHWGSAPPPPLPSAPPKPPRQALSFALAEEGFEPPAWRCAAGGGAPRALAERVALAAAQALVYADQAPLGEGVAQQLLDAFLAGSAGAAGFDRAYADRAVARGRWLAFKDKQRAAGGGGGGGAAAAADVARVFAAHAAAEMGFDAAAYV